MTKSGKTEMMMKMIRVKGERGGLWRKKSLKTKRLMVVVVVVVVVMVMFYQSLYHQLLYQLLQHHLLLPLMKKMREIWIVKGERRGLWRKKSLKMKILVMVMREIGKDNYDQPDFIPEPMT